MNKISTKLLKGTIIGSMTGFLLFLVFYVLAAKKFPGGTYANPRQKGFSFSENYLCDLLDDITYLLEDNPARLYARFALGFLCLGILLFWFHFPKLFERKTKRIEIMRISGILAMLVTAFLQPNNHDLITILAGFFGSIALILAFIELHRSAYIGLMVFGIICLVLILLNYYIYETRHWKEILPVLQKVTTAAGIIWFGLLNFKLLAKLKARS